MVYLPWNDVAEGGSAGVAAIVTTDTDVDFSSLEWQVIHLARQDALTSLQSRGRWAWLYRLFNGERSTPELASDRLEVLRQVAVEAWYRGYALHPARIAAFLSSGFTDHHLERLLAVITAVRGAPKARSFA